MAQNEENKESEIEDADLKIILLGDSAVGKSKLIERYLMSKYEPRQLSTYALTVYRHEIESNKLSENIQNDEITTIDFWDTVKIYIPE